jgi:UDP-4-amino-4,6-dideoxy-N-acetyl-beta-L-altrosamine transaminase
MIPYARQEITQADKDAVLAVLDADFLTQGPKVAEFELAVGYYCGAKHAVAVNSATSALHISCLALGVGPGDFVWTSPNSFLASANCALYCGAKIDFVDIESYSANMCAVALSHKLAQAEIAGVLPKVVIPVHFCGEPCDMQEIRKLADRYGFKIIEDASHAIGASHRDAKVGAARYGDITVFSFHPVKIVTTGEGGMAVTDDPAVAERLFLFRSHGMTRDPARMTEESHGPWYYQQVELGFNYRLTDIHAALGVSQLRRIDDFVERRQTLAERYDTLLAGMPVQALARNRFGRSALHLYVVQIPETVLPGGKRKLFDDMRQKGVGVNLHYIPIHMQPYYAKLGFRIGMFPQAEAYYRRAMTLPLYPGLTDAQQVLVVDALQESLG